MEPERSVLIKELGALEAEIVRAAVSCNAEELDLLRLVFHQASGFLVNGDNVTAAIVLRSRRPLPEQAARLPGRVIRIQPPPGRKRAAAR